MTLPCRQVVHVGLEVLDDTALVCRSKESSRVRKLHRSDGGIVRLQDGLEVEGQAVPQCELPARRPRQYAPRLWRPLHRFQHPFTRAP